MTRSILSLALLSLSLCALAQTPLPSKNDDRAIQHVKSTLASSFDSRLPRVTLEYLLTYETDGAPAKWIVTKCESAAPNVAQGRNSPTCVQADFDLNDGRGLTILIRVEGPSNEQSTIESLVSLAVTDLSGKVRQIRSLADLPMELHRAFPSTPPKDLPLPGRDS